MPSRYIIQVSLFVTCLMSYLWLEWSAQGQDKLANLNVALWKSTIRSINNTGIYLQLNGVNYSNNSESISDIGSGDEESLQSVFY